MTGGAIACRAVLLGGVGGLVGCATAGNPPSPSPSQSPADGRIAAAQAELAALETRFGGRLGVMAVDTATGAAGGHRPDERFLLASTVKVPIVAAILRRAEQEQGLLERLIRYDRSALLEYAPATTANLATGMTVAALCEAAITVSDNTAANLLFDLLGGPAAATAFVRTLGDPTTRLDRLEPELNLTTPGDQRDTTTVPRNVSKRFMESPPRGGDLDS
jgi:beta-lactamase class A